MSGLKRTPMHHLYEKYGARTIDFGGWEMPVQFSGIQKEHHAVRERAGLFDVSHMGEVKVYGSDSEAFLEHLTTNRVASLAVGQAQYTLMCYPEGGVVDDLLVYRLGEQEYMLVINASNTEKDIDWLQKHIDGDVQVEDISEEIALLALQGPRSAEILKQVTDVPIEEMDSFHFLQSVQVGDADVIVSKTGYTGEEGFELYIAREDAPSLWEQILTVGKDKGLEPIGLGARDTLRFEARLPLYGQELSPTVTPIEAGLGFFIKLDKGPFIGKEVLAEQKQHGAPRKLVGLEMVERGIPRPHYLVFAAREDEHPIGEVTTGTQSPTLKKNIGLALLIREYAAVGKEVYVDVRGKRLKAQLVRTPFYRRGGNA